MKFLKLSDHKLDKLVANVYKNDKNGNLYYIVRHGDLNVKNISAQYTLSIDSKLAKPKEESDIFVLEDETLTIKPIYVRGSLVKNKRNEQLYTITAERSGMPDKDMFVFWYIPANRCKHGDVTYTLQGNVNLIAEARYAKDRGEVIFSTPAPVLEIYGNCVLTWSGVDLDGKKHGQSITYDTLTEKFLFEYLKF